MAYLCITDVSNNTSTLTEVSTVDQCIGYIVKPSTDILTYGLTYTDANQILAATALLFSVSFVLRLTLKKLGY